MGESCIPFYDPGTQTESSRTPLVNTSIFAAEPKVYGMVYHLTQPSRLAESFMFLLGKYRKIPLQLLFHGPKWRFCVSHTTIYSNSTPPRQNCDAMARVLKHLPTAVSLWSPDDVAAFLRSKGQMEAAQRVEKSVRLHSFDEVDGPRVLRYGMKGLQGGLDVVVFLVGVHCFIYIYIHTSLLVQDFLLGEVTDSSKKNAKVQQLRKEMNSHFGTPKRLFVNKVCGYFGGI